MGTHVDHGEDEPACAHGVERADVGENALVHAEDCEDDADGAEDRKLARTIASVTSGARTDRRGEGGKGAVVQCKAGIWQLRSRDSGRT